MIVRFVSAERGSAFMLELLEVVAGAVTAAGGETSMHLGAFPADDGQSVYVVVPHEYFVLTPRERLPPPAVLGRTIGFCVEHPGTETFATSAAWVACLGGAVDINHASTEELRRRGIAAQRFVLGYSPRWDRWQGRATDRRIDITYLGTTDVRRDFLLCEQARTLADWRTALLVPPHEQMTKARPDFLMGAAKHDHLADSKVLLNLHRGGSHALEWVRVLEAMVNGCVVVSEHSTDIAPLVPGTHIAFARATAVADVASALLRHPDRLAELRDAAYALCRDELSMGGSASDLLHLATSLLAAPPGGRLGGRRPVPLPPVPVPAPAPPTDLPELAPWAQAIPPAGRMELAAALRRPRTSPDGLLVEERCTGDAGPGDSGPVDVVIASTGDSLAQALTLSSLAAQDVALRVVVGDDGRSSGVSVARGPIRNALLRQVTADLVLVVDPGQQLFPRAVRTLVAALVAEPTAAVAYPMVADTAAGVLWNSLPVEAFRLHWKVHLGAPLLIRREVLAQVGGYSEDPAVEGYEDHELWLRLVAGGHTGVLVPEILATGARTRPPPFGISRLAPDLTLEALERAWRGEAARPPG